VVGLFQLDSLDDCAGDLVNLTGQLIDHVFAGFAG
jgi:hypothetical protein